MILLTKKTWARIGFIFIFWNCFAVFSFTLSLYATFKRGAPFLWPYALISDLLIFNFWGIFSIFVIKHGSKFRIDRSRKLKHITLHLVSSFIVGLCHLALVLLIWRQLDFIHPTDKPFWQGYLKLVSKWLNFELLIYWGILGISYAFDRYSNKSKDETTPFFPGPGENWPERLAIKSDGSTYFVKVKDIEWIEAADYYVKIHANDSSHLLRETMKGLHRKLNPQKFLRIHRSTIVNIDRIKKLDPLYNGETAVILQNGTQLKLSRRRKKTLQLILGLPV